MTATKKHQQRKVIRLLHLLFLFIQISSVVFFFVWTSQTKFFFEHVKQNVEDQDSLIMKFKSTIDENVFSSLVHRNEGIKEYSNMGHDKAQTIINILPMYTLMIIAFTVFFVIRINKNDSGLKDEVLQS